MESDIRTPTRHWRDAAEKVVIAILGCALLVIRVIAAARYRFNTDEPQHLHVVWGWSKGMVQYRDLFDNHPPLFHMLMAPLFGLFSERADIVVVMRYWMIPFYLLSMLAVYRIGRSLYTERVGRWAALVAGAVPWFFFPGVEFRPDDLYAAVWLWAVVVMIEGTLTWRRACLAGVLMGACVAITMKTSLLVASLGTAGMIGLGLRYQLSSWRGSLSESFAEIAAFGGGAAIIPLFLCGYFAAVHSLPQFLYCVLKHNVVPQAERWSGSAIHYFFFPAGLPVLIALGVWIYKRAPRQDLAVRRVVVALLPAAYYLLLYSYWPDITEQDQLPAMPLVPLAIVPLFTPLVSSVGLPLAFAACLALIFRTQVIQRGAVKKFVSPIATVLQLTTPDEYVMDLKGDSIYRKRPIYYAIETFAKIRMKHGWIDDDLVPRLIETRTAVCFHPPFWGRESETFLRSNYLSLKDINNVFVLGQRLGSNGELKVMIPGEYVVLGDGKPLSGVLDGKAVSGKQMIEAGNHLFVPDKPAARVELFWARAFEKGYSPGD